jgi:hypothetical protein
MGSRVKHPRIVPLETPDNTSSESSDSEGEEGKEIQVDGVARRLRPLKFSCFFCFFFCKSVDLLLINFNMLLKPLLILPILLKASGAVM